MGNAFCVLLGGLVCSFCSVRENVHFVQFGRLVHFVQFGILVHFVYFLHFGRLNHSGERLRLVCV